MKKQLIQEVAQDCIAYAERYQCSLYDALEDYELMENRGPFERGPADLDVTGLTPAEKVQVAEELRRYGFRNIDAAPAQDYGAEKQIRGALE